MGRDIANELRIRHVQKLQYETVLVLQGGGSLGAYECGVFKTLHSHVIKFDIVSGTSIGAVNAGMIAGPKGAGDPAENLEAFWLDVAETVAPFPMGDMARAMAASYYSAVYGNSRAFLPTWHLPNADATMMQPFLPFTFGFQKPYAYELDPLKKTLARYIDFEKLNDPAKRAARLVVTCTDLKASEPVVFDSASTKMTADHLVACASFPLYGIAWTEIDGKYLWDGALLSNTPLREVIDVSPKHDKQVYIVNLFPHRQEQLPENMLDSWHKARDIMHTDRTDHNVRMSEVISRYLLILKEMHDMLSNVELKGDVKDRFLKLEKEYHKLAGLRGAIIDDIIRIERSEDIHYLFEDADFSIATIKKLIRQGEDDTEEALKKHKSDVKKRGR
ncbi:MAG TPA: patatin-like phospholipase family protein [Nitrososphaera sp.]|nr:patatin-like phospholipase family protein [Nitrososphaera sp.]